MPTRPDQDEYDGFCTSCRYHIRDFSVVDRCPNCGTTTDPCAWVHQVNISVNWQELRILCMYAEFYAKRLKKQGLIYGIVNDLLEQYPEIAKEFPLTFAGEMRLLKEQNPNSDITIIGPDGEVDHSFE